MILDIISSIISTVLKSNHALSLQYLKDFTTIIFIKWNTQRISKNANSMSVKEVFQETLG